MVRQPLKIQKLLNALHSSNQLARYQGAGLPKEAERLELQMDAFGEEVDAEVELLGIGPGTRVLDAGCGTGAFARRISRLVRPAVVTGVDIDPLFIRAGKRIAKAARVPNVKLEVGDLHRLRFHDSTFDLVYSRLVFWHLEDKLGALWEMKRVAKPGGRIALVFDSGVISTPYPRKFWSLVVKTGEAQNKHAMRNKSPRYVDVYRLMKKAGLRSVSVHPMVVMGSQRNPSQLRKLVDVAAMMPEVHKDEAIKGGFLTRNEYDAGINEIKRWLDKPDAVQLALLKMLVGVA